jgi:hypothetical protein
MKNQLLKEYIQKQVKSLLKEEVYGNKAIVYHRTKLNIEQLNDIFFNKKWSFGSNAGSMYGAGLYTTYSLESQMSNRMISAYGKNIIKFSVNLKNFLICDYEEFQKTPQYQRLNKPKEKDENGNLVFIIEQLKDKNIIVNDLYSKNLNYTSDTILYLLGKYKNIKLLFDGIMYTGSHDGKCCVVFFQSVYNTSIPLGYYTPKNDSTSNINDYQYISSFNKDKNFKNIVNDKLNNNLNNKNNNKLIKDKYLNSIINGEMNLSDVPENKRTKEICEIAVSDDGEALQYVPKHLIDYTLCEKAIFQTGFAIQFVPNTLENYYSLCEKAIIQNGTFLVYISNRFKDYSLCEKAVSNNGIALRFVPENTENYYSLCEKAISQNSRALRFVPENTENYYSLCKKAVSQNGIVLQYVPENFKTKELCEKAISIDGNSLQYVPEKYKDYRLCYKAVSTNQDNNDDYHNHALMYVPENLKDYRLCYKAVSVLGFILQYVPENLKDYKICYKAILDDKSVGIALQYVPENIENFYSLVKLAYIKNNWIYTEEYFPEYCNKYIPQLKEDFPNDRNLQIFNDYYIIKEYIQKQIKSLLKESVTDEVYHFTFLSNIINILQTNQFQLGLNNDPDDKNLKHKYYMSVSRTKSPKVGFLSFDSDDVREASMEYYDLDFMVRLKLNGRLLSQNYKAVPFNYTKHVYIKDKSHEYEDRILSNKPTIENFSKYIIQIDIKQVNNNYAEEEGEDALNEIINQLQNLCKQRNIKLNIVNPNKIDRNYLEEYIQNQVRKIIKESLNK